MNENVKVNNKKKQLAIFNSLLATEIHASFTKRQEEVNKELTQLEKEGKLRIYNPSRR